MPLPANVKELFSRPDTVKVLTTASKDGQPHAIVCGSIFVIDDSTLAVGEILMNTAKANMAENKKVALEVVAGKEAYEARCEVAGRLDSGPVLDALNGNLAKINLKANAVWTFTVKEVYDESAGPGAGKKIA